MTRKISNGGRRAYPDRRRITRRGTSRTGKPVRVTALRVGAMFASRTGREYGPGLWEVVAQTGRRCRRASLVATVAEMRRDVKRIADALGA